MLYNLEQGGEESPPAESEIFSEDGELLRLERRNGKQVAVGPKARPGGNPQGRNADKNDEGFVRPQRTLRPGL